MIVNIISFDLAPPKLNNILISEGKVIIVDSSSKQNKDGKDDSK